MTDKEKQMTDLNERKKNGILPTCSTAANSGIMPDPTKPSDIKPPDKPSDPKPVTPLPSKLTTWEKVVAGLTVAAPIVAVLSAMLAITFCVLVFVPTPYVTAHYETFCRLNIAMPIVAIVFSLISALIAASDEKYKPYNGKVKFYHFNRWDTRNQVMFIGSIIVIVLSVVSLLCGSIYGYLQLGKMNKDVPSSNDGTVVAPPEEKKVTITAGMTYDEVVAELSGVKNFTLREIDKNGERTDAALFTENGATYSDSFTAIIENNKCVIIMFDKVEGDSITCVDYTGYDYDFDCAETSEIRVTADSIFKQMPSTTDGFRTEDGKVIFYNDEDGDYAELCNFNSTELYIPEEYKDYASMTAVSPVIAKPLAYDDTKCSVYVYGFLKSIDIPSEIDGRTVVQIESTSSWSTLKKVTIPKTVTSISARAFANCTALEEIHFDGTEEEWAAVEKGEDWDKDAGEYILTFVVVEKTLSYALNSAGTAYIVNGIGNCDETDLVIPETYNDLPVVGISKSAFSGCSHLTSVTIPASVTSIGRGAFSGCSGLTSMTIPFVGASKEADSSRYPFGYVFGESSYDGGTATKQIYEVGGSTTLSTYYVPSGLTSVTVLGGEVPYGAFYNCSALTEISLNAEVSAIGNFALSGCSGLESVTVPFIGASKTAGSADYPFGYAFGTTAYNGGIATTQTYSVKSSATTSTTTSTTYYIPSGLTSVTVLGGGVPEGAFWGCGGLTEIVLPEDCKTIGVRAFYNCARLTEIIIPSTVEYLNHDAFNGCSALESVNIPNKITVITGGLFSGCTNLKTITIPASVKSIGEKAFENCVLLANVTIPNGVTTISQEAFAGCASFTAISISDNVTSIGEGAFSGCSAVESIVVSGGNENYHSSGNCLIENKNGTLLAGCKNSVIPDDESVKKISAKAFKGCKGLANLVIPKNITEIGDYAFYGCSEIETITFAATISNIGGYAFAGCTALADIYYDGAGTKWDALDKGANWDANDGNYIMHFAENLAYALNDEGTAYTVTGIGNITGTNIIIPSTYLGLPVTAIGENAFKSNAAITSVTIGDNVTSIDDSAFYYCIGLTSITIGDNVESIGYGAFYSCKGLTNIIIPSKVDSIGYGAFWLCEGLKNVTILNGVTTICDNAFGNCNGITNIIIPDTVTSIGKSAFFNCNGLTSITIGRGVTYIGDDTFGAFLDCYKLVEVYNKSSLTITAGSEDNGYVGYYAKNVYTEEGGSKLSTDENGYIIYTDGNDKILVGYTGTETELTLPNGITKIYEYAFYKNANLTSITIPDSVTIIGDGAFQKCEKLTNVNIGVGVISIGSYAFADCKKLVEIVFNGSEGQWLNWVSKCTGWDENTGDYTVYYYGLSYSLNDEGTAYTVTGIGNITGTNIVIPSTYFGLPVTAIGEKAFKRNADITSVTIGDNVTSIGYGSFYDCDNLRRVVMGQDVTSIGDWAFFSCNFVSITIERNTTDIGEHAFYSCSRLVEIYNKSSLNVIAGEIDNGYVGYYAKNVYTEDGGSKLSTDENGYIIYTDGDNKILIGYAGSETELILPDGITEIDGLAFYKNTKITNVIVPNSVTSIDNSAFYGCTNLININIADKVQIIGSNAFNYCSNIKSIRLGDSVIEIGSFAFANCSSLTNIEISNGVTDIGLGAFENCTGLTNITIGNSVTKIGNSAFDGCKSIETVTIPSSVTDIDNFAFRGCIALKKIYYKGTREQWNSITKGTDWDKNIENYTVRCNDDFTMALNDEGTAYTVTGIGKFTGTDFVIPATYNGLPVTAIGERAFSENDTIISVVIPDSVKRIGADAFHGCTELTDITIPNSVTSIGGSAFNGCTGLTNITIPDSVTSIGEHAFFGCSGLTNVTIGNSVTNLGEYAFFGCSGLTNVTIGNSVTSIGGSAFNGCTGLASIMFGENSQLTSIGGAAFSGCTGLTSITIPDSVTSIGGSAFNECTGLTNITIPDSVTNLGEYAFFGCSGLTNVTIGNSVTSIGYRAFESCSGLTSITIPDSVTSIGGSAFHGCTGLTNITIPDSVTSIGERAFSYCSGLTSVTIGNSVTSIGSSAFINCTGLTSVTIGNSVTSIGSWSFLGCTGLTSLTIPNSVTSIGEHAFYYCTGLTNITFEDTTTWYITTSEDNWNNKTNGTQVSVADSSTNATDFTYNGNYYWYKL